MSWRWRLIGLPAVVLPVAACAMSRPQPAPVTPRPPAETTAAAWPPMAPPVSVGASLDGLAGVRTVLLFGWGWTAEPILEEVEQAARASGDQMLLANALTQRAVLAWRRNGEEEAAALLDRAVDADPHGPFGRAAHLMREVMEQLGERQRELNRIRDRLGSVEREREQSESQARVLAGEVAGLRRQLDELKQVHLQIESEKEDAPSRAGASRRHRE